MIYYPNVVTNNSPVNYLFVSSTPMSYNHTLRLLYLTNGLFMFAGIMLTPILPYLQRTSMQP